MELWTSAEVWADFSRTLSAATNHIENVVNERLAGKTYGNGVKEWAFIAILLPPDIRDQYPERFKYHKSDKSVEFRLHLDWEAFKTGDEAAHRRLVSKALLRSLDLLDEKRVPDFDHRKLREDFSQIAKAQQWL